MKKITNEFKVGLFIVLCLLGLAYLTYSTGKLDFKKAGYNIYVVFDQVSGLEKKSPVRLNGVEVGKVQEINLAYDADKTQVILKLWLKDEAKIRENPEVSIKTMGLMGEKYVQIASSEGKEFVAPGATLAGSPGSDLDALMKELRAVSKGLSQQVSELLASINGTLGDNKQSISQIIKNLESTTKNFDEFSADLKAHPWKLLFKGKEKPKKKDK